MPDINIPTIDLSKAAEDFNKAVKDGAYVAVGLGVLGFQKAQVQRVELMKQLEAQISQLGTLPDSLSSQIETYLSGAREQLSTAAGNIETQVEAFRSQLTELAKTIDERVTPARRQFDEQLDQAIERLPENTRGVVTSVRSAVQSQEAALRSAVGLD